MQNTLVKIKETWSNVPQIAKMLIYAAITAIGIFLLVYLFAPDKYQTLYTGLEPEDSLEIQQYLSTKGVDYKLNEDGTTIMADGDIILLKRDLALQNLPQGGMAGGLSQFDNLSIGSTKFDKEVQYQNRLQQELENSIVKAFDGITSANVKLPRIEEKSIFDEQDGNMNMSVALKMKNGYEMSAENVRAIQVFVASSIQEVKPEDVEIVDSKMNVLSKSEDGSGIGTSTGKQTEIVKGTKDQIEKELTQALSEIYGKVRVIASVDINFDEIVQNIEKYDPQGTIISKEENKEATREANTPNGGAVGTDQNGEVPRYEIEDLEAEDILYLQDKDNLIENFVVGKTVEKVIKHPELRNINVAVWVDTDLSQNEIQELEEMISISSGLTGQAARDASNKAIYDNGSVKVSQRQFAQADTQEIVEEELPGFQMKWWYWVIIGVIILLLIGAIIALLNGRRKKKKMFLLSEQNREELENRKNNENNEVDIEVGEDYQSDLEMQEKFKFKWTDKQANLRESTNEVSKKFPKETADVIKKFLKNSN